MATTNGVDSARKLFAEQFEQDAHGITYRRYQKGAAFRVTQEERDRFIRQFDRAMSRGFWAVAAVILTVSASVIALSIRGVSELHEPLLYAVMGALVLAYVWYVHWAWVAPTRALARRTPVASKRSAAEVRQLTFARLSYGQLVLAGLAGAILPLVLAADNDPFIGWSGIWLAAGAALVSLAVIQAFRKWRFERKSNSGSAILQQRGSGFDPFGLGSASNGYGLLRYIPVALFLGGIAFIAYTDAGRRLAAKPSFLPILFTAFACWSLFTVVRGLQTGQVQPFVKGMNDTYDRSGAPRRYWASIAWNSIVGLGLIWIA